MCPSLRDLLCPLSIQCRQNLGRHFFHNANIHLHGAYQVLFPLSVSEGWCYLITLIWSQGWRRWRGDGPGWFGNREIRLESPDLCWGRLAAACSLPGPPHPAWITWHMGVGHITRSCESGVSHMTRVHDQEWVIWSGWFTWPYYYVHH